MRKTLYLFLGFALIVSTAKGFSASTDCQRWVADYKTALAQKTSAQHLLAARNRARAAARRRLAKLTTGPVTPHPAHPTRISSIRPHLTPTQMLKRFDLACGELPVENAVADERVSPDDFISEVALGGPLEVGGVPLDGTLIAENAPPVLTLTGIDTTGPQAGTPFVPTYGPVFGGGPTLGGGGPVYGGGGGSSLPIAPGTPGQGTSPGGPAGTSPIVPTTPVPPISAVPEPSSVVLMLTGLAGGLVFATKRSLS